MDRRAFFKNAFRRTAEEAVKLIDEKVTDDAIHWIRPPYALAELEFLLSCTRCDACIEACPHTVIFPLQARLGTKVAATPALDLLNKGCHLCADWPCVNACEQGALAFPVQEQQEDEEEKATEANAKPIPLPNLASVSINTETCFPYSGPECGACNRCPVEGALVWDQQRPSINEEKCVGCGLCREYCIVEPKAVDLVQV
jgi:ferredoxin-type protein NapG